MEKFDSKNAYLLFSLNSNESPIFSYGNPGVFFENFSKLRCLSCGTTHILGFQKSDQILPPSISCTVCQQIIVVQGYQERKVRRHPLVKSVHFQQEDKTQTKANVVDFSPAGLRLSCRKGVEAEGKIKIFCKDFDAEGEAMWMRKVGSFLLPTYEIGIRFESFIPHNRDVLTAQSI